MMLPIALAETMTSDGQLTGWQLKGNASEMYEAYYVPPIFTQFAEELVDLAGVAPGDRVLDVACGTGIVSRTAAGRVGPRGKVVGVDINDAMLAVARATARDMLPAIEWRQANATSLGVPERSFDVALCQQAVQFFTDRVAALDAMRRALVPGGRLAFSSWRAIEHNPAYRIIADALEEHVGPDAATMERSPFAFHTADEVRTLATEAGFKDARVLISVRPVRFPSASELVRREIAGSPLSSELGTHKGLETILASADKLLAKYVDDAGVVFPMETYVVLARA